MSVEHRSPQTVFSVTETAQASFEAVNSRFPGIVTQEDALEITQALFERARYTGHIGALTQGMLYRIVRERSEPTGDCQMQIGCETISSQQETEASQFKVFGEL